MNTIHATPRFLLLRETASVTSEKPRIALKTQADHLEKLVGEFLDEVRRADNDPGRNRIGRRQAVIETKERWRPKLADDGLGQRHIDHFRGLAEEGRKKALDPARRLRATHDLEPQVAEARKREVRDRIERIRERGETDDGLGPERRIARLLEMAADEDDRIVLSAVEEAPSTFPVLDEAALDGLRERHSRGLFPEEWAQIDEYERVAGLLSFNREQVLRQLGDVGLRFDDAPVILDGT